MVNVSKLKGKIIERNTTQEALAKDIGIDKSTFYRKMKQNGSFSIQEVNLIVSSLGLSKDEALSIFLAKQSHKCDKLKKGIL
ncbi:phage repressor [Streptococcus pneumoniae]|nr:phage repressor [Streptococcus pneumoniae]